jgi:hypothetical protein
VGVCYCGVYHGGGSSSMVERVIESGVQVCV